MTPDDLVDRYPRLWHMADIRNTAGIFDRGLLCTSLILSLYGIRGAARAAIEGTRRPDNISLEDARYGTTVIRDQKPLSLKRIAATLEDATPEEFLKFLNAQVFFWPTVQRLTTMNNARAYRETDQLVLVINTRSLAAAHSRTIRLSPINSGATSPFAWPRSVGMFKKIPDFDYEARRRCKDPIAEVTVAKGVPDIIEHVERLEVWRGGELQRTLRSPYAKPDVLRRLGYG